MDLTGTLLRKTLEEVFDIPFQVKAKSEYKDPYFLIYPKNDMNELFEITLLYRQHIRLILEIYPQKYSSDMIQDMQMADNDKLNLFAKYMDNVKKKRW